MKILEKVNVRTWGARLALLIVHLLSVYEALIFVLSLGRYVPGEGRAAFLFSDACDRIEQWGG